MRSRRSILVSIVVAASLRAEESAVLEDEAVRLAFSPRGLTALIDKRAGTVYRAADVAPEFFRLELRPRGAGPPRLLSAARDAEVDRLAVRRGELGGTYRFLGGRLTATPAVTLAGGGISRWSLILRNDTVDEVTGIQFPLLTGVRVGDSLQDDILLVNTFGEPATRSPARDPAPALALPRMRWMDLHDARGGVYVGDHHTDFAFLNDVRLRAIPACDRATIELALDTGVHVAPAREVTLESRIVALHAGDWHAGADLYRAEVASRLAPPPYPGWMRSCDVWSYPAGEAPAPRASRPAAVEWIEMVTDATPTVCLDPFARDADDDVRRLAERAATARRRAPDGAVFAVNASDVVGQVGFPHLLVDGDAGGAVFRYTVPEQLVVAGGLTPDAAGAARARQAFLTGARFAGAPTNSALAAALLDLRRATATILHASRYMDTVGLELSPPAAGGEAEARWFRLEDDYQRVYAINTRTAGPTAARTVSLRPGGSGHVRRAWVYAMGGGFAETPCVSDAGAWRVELPRAELATVVLVDRARPAIRFADGDLTAAATGTTVRVAVCIRNLESEEGVARLEWQPPAGCTATAVDSGVLQPGEERTVSVPLSVGTNAPAGRHDLPLRLYWRGAEGRAYHRLSMAGPEESVRP